ncbi:terminase small subunit [uncultured Clostridium sp.]|uniref:terminase small subunit n=1 Tax=uncultured Clostridium sp. TaxID=59620 RepID=UPI0025D25EEE|nr:terminase small subunit [uncultured Clostridium sp.]
MSCEVGPEYFLNERQKRFVNEYIKDLNGTRAYRKVYQCKNDETAAVCASQLLRNPNVKEYLDIKLKDREKRLEITQDRVLKELAKIGFANITNFTDVVDIPYEVDKIDEDGTIIGKETKYYKGLRLYNTEDITEDELSALQEIKEGKHGITVKMHDKVRALEQLGRHLGMFNDKLDVNTKVDLTAISNLTTEEIRKLIQE